MKRLAATALAAFVLCGNAGAHTLDEYVQALRVLVAPEELLLYLDLTPGMNIAADVLRRIDANDDGVLSPMEAEAYGRAVLMDLDASIDGAPLPLSLQRVELPAVEEMRSGQGVLRIEIAARTVPARGRHQLQVRNRHLPSVSVYLANALMPDSAGISILRQTRDVRQQTFRVDYEVRAVNVTAIGWLAFAGAGLVVLQRLRFGARFHGTGNWSRLG
jgi:hypothetical protein